MQVCVHPHLKFPKVIMQYQIYAIWVHIIFRNIIVFVRQGQDKTPGATRENWKAQAWPLCFDMTRETACPRTQKQNKADWHPFSPQPPMDRICMWLTSSAWASSRATIKDSWPVQTYHESAELEQPSKELPQTWIKHKTNGMHKQPFKSQTPCI